MEFSTYQKEAKQYDYTEDIFVPLMGLLGEIGEISSVLKKRARDRRKDRDNLVEELGDTLWYISIICNYLDLQLKDLANNNLRRTGAASKTHKCKDFSEYQRLVEKSSSKRSLYSLSALSKNAANLFKIYTDTDKDHRKSKKFINKMEEEVGDVLWYLVNIACIYDIKMSEVASNNLDKIRKIHDPGELSKFDLDFSADESFPRQFAIKFMEVDEKDMVKVKIYFDDQEIGDPLDDNVATEDFYRYHDVFHLAYIAILGWSPVFRKLLNRKRKSDRDTDRIQDGARARILDEAVSLYIFNDAVKHNLYKDSSNIDLSVLKTVKELTKDLEVSFCTYKQWEDAILKGYKIYRQLIEHRKGIVKLDLDKPDISFSELKD